MPFWPIPSPAQRQVPPLTILRPYARWTHVPAHPGNNLERSDVGYKPSVMAASAQFKTNPPEKLFRVVLQGHFQLRPPC